MKYKMKSNPANSFHDAPLYYDEWISDNEKCPNCKKSFPEHNTGQAVDCALAIIERGEK